MPVTPPRCSPPSGSGHSQPEQSAPWSTLSQRPGNHVDIVWQARGVTQKRDPVAWVR